MTYEKIIAETRAGKYAPVYLLMGEEPYFIDQITQVIDRGAIPEDLKSFNHTVLYGADTSIEQIVSLAKSFPMMGDRQLIIIKEAQALEKKIQDLKSYCAQPLDSTILVLNYKGKKVDKRTELYKNIEKNGVVFTSETVRDYKVPAWIQDHVKTMGLKINEKQSNILSNFLGNDLSRIHSELTKLQGIVNGGEVTDEMIEKYIGVSKEYNIYEFQRAVLIRNYGLVLKITDHYTKNPKSMHIIPAIGALYNVFTRWIKFYYLKDKSKPNAMQAGVTAFFYRDYQESLRKYTIREMVENIRILKEFDLKSKGLGGSGSDPEGLFIEMMQRLVLR